MYPANSGGPKKDKGGVSVNVCKLNWAKSADYLRDTKSNRRGSNALSTAGGTGPVGSVQPPRSATFASPPAFQDAPSRNALAFILSTCPAGLLSVSKLGLHCDLQLEYYSYVESIPY